MMRLFVTQDARTVIVMIPGGATMTDLYEKCKQRLGNDEVRELCLNVEGMPVIEDVGELRDGDRVCVKMDEDMTTGEDTTTGDLQDTKINDEGTDSSDDSNDEDSKEDSDEDSEDEDDSDDDYEPQSKRTKTDTVRSQLTMEATMDKDTVAPLSASSSADDDIKERIRNILKRGLHPTTPEAEAENSMRLAERMLRKHNISRAEVMLGAEDASVNGDMFKVHIRNPQTGKPSTTKHWFHDLARAMTTHFQCKYYYKVRQGTRCLFSFYGIASNAYAAAFAFETAFNRIMILVSEHTVPKGEYDRKLLAGEISCCRATYTKLAKVSYCDGVAIGLLQRVRQASHQTKAPDGDEADTVTPEDETRLACLTKKVEESILQKNSIKLSKSKRTYTRTPCRVESYVAGKRDSSHINIQQRSIA